MTRTAAGPNEKDGDQGDQGGKTTTTQRATKASFHADEKDLAEIILPFKEDVDCADQIKAYRKKYGLTQKEMGERLGVREGTIRSWEKSYSKPPYHIWKQYLLLLNDTT